MSNESEMIELTLVPPYGSREGPTSILVDKQRFEDRIAAGSEPINAALGAFMPDVGILQKPKSSTHWRHMPHRRTKR